MSLSKALMAAPALLLPIGGLSAAPLPLIDISATNGGYEGVGIVLGQDTADATFDGRISVTRTGKSGSLKIVQSGEAMVSKGERAIIATSNFSATPEDHLVILFEILLENRVVAVSTIEIPDPSKK